ncbi:unnamed protein product, partial [Mesorhabditis belari]|uniref:Uncharacterized protein n=1 Tax=Mesorhabditis belari TaxID=2138241 RepID=A0AAF3FN26_9BILA
MTFASFLSSLLVGGFLVALASGPARCFSSFRPFGTKAKGPPLSTLYDQSKSFDVVIEGSDKDAGSMQRKTVSYARATLQPRIQMKNFAAYNIVGDGTPQAFHSNIDWKNRRRRLPLTRKRFSTANYVDDVYPFIWKNFSDAGYATLYGEDAANIGTFTYRLKGFRNQPTDHYTWDLFSGTRESSMGYMQWIVPVYKTMVPATAREFMKAYKDFTSVFNDTFQCFPMTMSMRYAKLRGTHQGQLEERLPFFAFAVPQSDILSTPFDIHATLMDILHLPNEKIYKPLKMLRKDRFHSFDHCRYQGPVNKARSTHIGATCLNWEDATQKPEEKTLVEGMAHSVVDAINAQTTHLNGLSVRHYV